VLKQVDELDDDKVTNVLSTTQEYNEVFAELKRDDATGHILITSVLNFDDMADQLKMERYQQTSVPLHQVTLFAKTNIKGKVSGSLLARSHLSPLFSHNRARMFEPSK